MIEKFKPKKIIGVCGGSVISEDVYQMAQNLGEELAKEKYIIVCGGKGGTMEAVCKGAKKYNGQTLGILPSKDPQEANAYIDISIPTGLGEGRNNLIVNTAHAIIFIAGGAGTLTEIALAWQAQKPMVALIPSGGWSQKLAGGKIDSTRSDQIHGVESPQEAEIGRAHV